MRLLKIALALSLGLLVACSGVDDSATTATAPSDAASPGAALSQEPIRLAVGIDTAYAPMFLADQEGLFEQAGVNVEIVQFAQGGEGVDAAIAGTVQMAGSGDATVLGKSTRGDLKALAIFQESGQYMKLVVRDGVTDAQQIKRMGVVPGSLSEYAATRLLAKEDLAQDSVEFVSAGPPELPALLSRGDIDAFVLWEPWPATAEKQGATILEPTQAFDYAYVQFIVAAGPWFAEHQPEARAVVQALAEASQRVEDDPAAAAQATEAATKIPLADSEKAIQEIDFGVREPTEADRTNFADISTFLQDRKIVDTAPDLDTLLVPGFAPS